MASRYKPIRKPIYAPNASASGYGKYEVKDGDYIIYHTRGCPTIGRVLAQATHDGQGNKYATPVLLVLQASDNMTFGYIRHISIEDVSQIYRRGEGMNGDFAEWFFKGDLPSVQEVERAVDFGAMSDNYIGRYLEDGRLVGFAEGERPIHRNPASSPKLKNKLLR
jgi:hypothetical protein